jgi:NADPH:quinone reductase-like Zn-dependent oxidoreductase
MEYKKIIITQRGGKEKLKLIKEPKENLYKNLNKKEAIIKILASGVAYADIMMREVIQDILPILLHQVMIL